MNFSVQFALSLIDFFPNSKTIVFFSFGQTELSGIDKISVIPSFHCFSSLTSIILVKCKTYKENYKDFWCLPDVAHHTVKD